MNWQRIDDDLRSAALSIAQQIADGLLNRYPQHKKAAQEQLRSHIECGVVTLEDLEGLTGLWE